MSMAAMAHNTAVMPHKAAAANTGNFESAGPAPAASSGGRGGDGLLNLASSKQISNVEEQPLVTIDLFGNGAVRFVPPEGLREEKEPIGKVAGRVPSSLSFRKNEASYKAVKKMLSKGGEEDFLRVFNDALVIAPSSNDDGCITVPDPALLLGVRRVSHLSEDTKKRYPHDSSPSKSSTAGAIEPVTHPFQIRDQTLDGGSVPRGNDYDRVVIQLDLLPGKKKPLILLPEDAVMILLHYGRKLVYDVLKKKMGDDAVSGGWSEYPLSVPLPPAGRSDPMVETLVEMGLSMSLLHNSAAVVLNDHFSGENKSLRACVGARMTALSMDEEEEGLAPVIYLVSDNVSGGVDVTVIRIGIPCEDGTNTYTVVSEVSGEINSAFQEAIDCADKYLQENEGTPCCVATYGSKPSQTAMQKSLKPLLKQMTVTMPADKRSTKEVHPILVSTNEDAAVEGSSILFGLQYQRLEGAAPQFKYVTVTAVGIAVTYEGGEVDKDNIKIIFDIDRRVPAGPYQIDYTAAECASVRAKKTIDVEEEDVAKYKGFKNIPLREDAAKRLRVQVVQKMRSSGEWIEVGDVMKPLLNEKEDDGDKEGGTCIENSRLELSLGENGVITNRLIKEGDSIVQANKSERWSKISKYLWIAFAILFFGGFMFKSWYEDRVFQRDVKRLLEYYKHVVPGSFNDGDLHNARYLVYKYRHKKKRLWKGLEVKYNVAIPDSWPEEEEEEHKEEEDDEEIDLDSDDHKKEEESGKTGNEF